MKNLSHSWLYWSLQLGGWLAFFGLNLFINYSTGRLDSMGVVFIALVIFSGFLVSHVFRWIIQKIKVFEKSLKAQLFLLVVIWVGGSIAQSLLQFLIVASFDWGNDPDYNLNFSKFIIAMFNWLIIYLIWLMLYTFYQYVQKQRSKIIQELKLKALGNEIELNNLRSQLNPHFMFNSMNSIRALVDENPNNAKIAITKLSSILRSALQFSKRNFIDFSEELEFVNDYLFLEKIRFEERLEFLFDVDAHLRTVKFPPLMLQTIVENAIKHGISNLPNGGSIKISAKQIGTTQCFTVTNSGVLNNNSVESGIGLMNTHKRLKLLYGPDASFKLYEQNGNVVSEIIIPIKK